jgi:hypothetical protein
MGRCDKNSILTAGVRAVKHIADGKKFPMRGAAAALAFMLAAACIASCGNVQDKLDRINPDLVARQFFEAWQNRDWKALYLLTHPAFIQQLRMQKLSPEQRGMSDQELFISEFKREQGLNPARVMKTYEIRSISPYKKGDTTVWCDALVNGRKRKIPLTLDGLSLKIDMTRIE